MLCIIVKLKYLLNVLIFSTSINLIFFIDKVKIKFKLN